MYLTSHSNASAQSTVWPRFADASARGALRAKPSPPQPFSTQATLSWRFPSPSPTLTTHDRHPPTSAASPPARARGNTTAAPPPPHPLCYPPFCQCLPPFKSSSFQAPSPTAPLSSHLHRARAMLPPSSCRALLASATATTMTTTTTTIPLAIALFFTFT